MSAEMTPVFQDAMMRHFGQHVVGLAGTYYQLDEAGQRTSEEKFSFYTGCIFSVKSEWWIVTAGHVFDDLEPAVRNKQVEVAQQILVDYFGDDSPNQKPVPFDFLSMRKVWKYEKGLDFAVIPVTPHYRNLLEKSKLVPLNEVAFVPPLDIAYYQYRIYGCPEYLIKENRLASNQPLTGYVKAIFPLVKREPDDTTQEYPRFKGVVEEGITSVKGLSGGPILGLSMYKGNHIYSVLALQSKWNKCSREVYGCPCSLFVPMAEQMLKG
jgi:hypothetical protein